MVTLPAATPLTVTEHFPAESLQVGGMNATFPVPENFDQVIVPVCEGALPVTVAVQVTEVPTAKVDLVHVIDATVFALMTARLVVPFDGESLESPPYNALIVTGDLAVFGVNVTEHVL
jgi:hypothetical protein